MAISMSQEDADFLFKSKNEMKVQLTIKSRHDDSIYSLFNLINQETQHPVVGEQFSITIPEIKTSRSLRSIFTPYWIRLDINNSGIDKGENSRLTCFQTGHRTRFAVLDQELLPSDISSGAIFKDVKIEVSCSVNKEI